MKFFLILLFSLTAYVSATDMLYHTFKEDGCFPEGTDFWRARMQSKYVLERVYDFAVNSMTHDYQLPLAEEILAGKRRTLPINDIDKLLAQALIHRGIHIYKDIVELTQELNEIKTIREKAKATVRLEMQLEEAERLQYESLLMQAEEEKYQKGRLALLKCRQEHEKKAQARQAKRYNLEEKYIEYIQRHCLGKQPCSLDDRCRLFK